MFYLDSVYLAKHQPRGSIKKLLDIVEAEEMDRALVKKYLTMYLTNWCNNQKRAFTQEVIPDLGHSPSSSSPSPQAPATPLLTPSPPSAPSPLLTSPPLTALSLMSAPVSLPIQPIEVPSKSKSGSSATSQKMHHPPGPRLSAANQLYLALESVQGRKFIRLLFKYGVADDEDLCLLLNIHTSQNICLMGMFKDNGIVKKLK
ncbi:hypothetical protein C8J57DRAFT_1249697 [Mycena rebaudengoi]|nr:hypothetical protein C8J57DRAFT_1249697 [Mycena rebaudengoi]